MAGAARIACLFLLASASLARGIDFLDEQQPIPEAAQYDSAQYRTSGGERALAEAKRQTYDLQQYPQAAQRFAQLLQQHPYKSALWVYLARAQYHSQDLTLARQTLARAGEAMPELQGSFWQPMDQSLLGEVRRQAVQLQGQVDFYPERVADLAPLIRLYRFLQDSAAAQGVVRIALERRRELYQQAEVASGAQRLSYLRAATQWDQLAGSLSREMDSTAALPGSAALADSLKEVEALRLLQLRVDYYLAKPQEYQQLCAEYLRLGRRAQAAAVIAALEREERRLNLLESIAPNAAEGDKYQRQASALSALGQQLKAQLDAAPP
jgi:hypothetical protein